MKAGMAGYLKSLLAEMNGAALWERMRRGIALA
jgi:hypothetical protein